MPDSPSTPVERPWLVALVLVPTIVAVVFCVHAAGGVITWSIDDMAGFHLLGAMILLSVKRERWRWWHWAAAGGALGAFTGVARWTIHSVFTPDAPIPFVEAVIASAVLTACWTLFMGIGFSQSQRVLARLGGRA